MEKGEKTYKIDHHLSKIDQAEKNKDKSRVIIFFSLFIFVLISSFLLLPNNEEKTKEQNSLLDNNAIEVQGAKAISVKNNIKQSSNKLNSNSRASNEIVEPGLNLNAGEIKTNQIAKESEIRIKNKNILIPASFPGGMSKMEDFLKKNVNYPKSALEKGISGNVNIQLQIGKDGSISKEKIIDSLGFGCDEEVIRAVSQMPTWIPASIDGRPISKSYIITVSFELPK